MLALSDAVVGSAAGTGTSTGRGGLRLASSHAVRHLTGSAVADEDTVAGTFDGVGWCAICLGYAHARRSLFAERGQQRVFWGCDRREQD